MGLNLYSHDTSVCILDRQGDCLFAGQKERLTRVKHDAGDASELVQHALESAGVTLHDVSLVVVNNHHYRVAPFERRLGWSVSMGHYPRSYADPFNLFPGVTKVELSHHLAHAWGAVSTNIQAAPYPCADESCIEIEWSFAQHIANPCLLSRSCK